MRYPQGIPAPNFAYFRLRGTQSRQFGQFEQPVASQSREIDIFVNFNPKSGTSGLSRFCPNRQVLIQAPRRRAFLLRGYNLRSHTKLQVARTPRRRV